MNSLAEENYLKALYNLANDKGEVSVNELSKQLNIKMPTVNSMMKKLSEKNQVIYQSYKPIKLTSEGEKSAALIIRKHRLTEMFLVKMMGFGWEEVHEVAEQIEHIKSSKFFDKMDELLGHPKFDPHGSPIPDNQGNSTWINYINLSEGEVGKTYVIKAVTNSSNDFLKFLNSKSISLDIAVHIKSIETFDGSITLEIDNKRIETYSKLVVERLLVTPI